MSGRPRKAHALEQRIAAWQDASYLKPDSILGFMQDVRKCLEAEGSKKQYPVLSTYCDWLVHDELSNAQHGRILKGLAAVILSHSGTLHTHGVSGREIVMSGLLIEQFLDELGRFLITIGVKADFLLDQPLTNIFVICLLISLADQPISPKDRSAISGTLDPSLIDTDRLTGSVLLQSVEVVRRQSDPSGSSAEFQLLISGIHISNGSQFAMLYNLFDAAAFGIDRSALISPVDRWEPVLTLPWL